jgi:hypothetical protein
MSILLAILIPLLVIATKLALNYRMWLRREIKGTSNKTVKHSIEWGLMATACLYSVYLLSTFSKLQIWFSFPLSAALEMAFIWLVFDGLYNKLRGFNWWFTGSVDKDDAVTDTFLHSLSLRQHIAIKTIPLIVFLITYLVLLK